jgi:AcrR family transcriptional regulator
MAPLSIDLIVTAAFNILDKQGVAGFTMRAVAKALRVTPMALYNHVADKAELAALVVNSEIHEHPAPTPTGVWQEDLWMIAQWSRERRLAHPALSELQRAYRIWTPAMYQHSELWVSLWQQSGLDAEQALRAARTSGLAVGGLMDQDLLYRDSLPEQQAMMSMTPRARLLFSGDRDPSRNFEEGVRAVIEGLYTRMLREQRKRIGAKKPKGKRRPSK